MKSSGIGGQAVLEGVMMKNQKRYAVAVRRPDGEIEVKTFDTTGVANNERIQKIPILRGIVNFVTSLILGINTLTYSASFYDDEEEAEKDKTSEKKEKLIMGGTVALSILLAVSIFMLLPYGISLLFQHWITSVTVLSVLEGMVRLLIFFGYIVLISRMEEIKRVFMYHGAEHKCINCIEHGMELNLENVKMSSRLHKRCGTSFLFIVIIISVIFFLFIRIESPLTRLVVRLLLIPVIAGVSYEFIKLAGRSEGKIVNLLSKPGLCLQKLTTKEPDDDMIEVGMAAVNAVFDWKKYLQENQNELQGNFAGGNQSTAAGGDCGSAD